MSVGLKTQVKAWIGKVASSIGVSGVFLQEMNDVEAVKLLNSISNAINMGSQIATSKLSQKSTTFATKGNDAGAKPPTNEVKARQQKVYSKASSSELFKNPDTLHLPVKRSGGRTSVLELGKAFDKRAKEEGYYIPLPGAGKGYTDEQKNQIADAMADDAEIQLREDDSGIGWYDAKTKSAIELMSSGNFRRNEENFFKIVEKNTGINKTNFNDSVWKLINESGK
jgi:hypothetical protein